jgi:hypothetical protein
MQFGTAEHFRTHYINFVVADFDGTYHTILGRPALTKFMAVLHYSSVATAYAPIQLRLSLF